MIKMLTPPDSNSNGTQNLASGGHLEWRHT